MANEFELIYQSIAPLAATAQADGVALGIGDDAALLQVPEGYQLVTSMDTLVAGRHFFVGTSAADIGWKALAVNLSDMAAMGAEPKWALLSLSLPADYAQTRWIGEFMQGWQALADQYAVSLVGGDTTASEQLVISVTLMGIVPQNQGILRSGAQLGDDIWLSHSIGDAGLAVVQYQQQQQPTDSVAMRLHRPQPHVSLGAALRPYANAMMDVSDGFIQDLEHLLLASSQRLSAKQANSIVLGASCYLESFQFSNQVQAWQASERNLVLPLTSGDDYVLLFTASPEHRQAIAQLQTGDYRLQRVGEVTATQGVKVHWQQQQLPLPTQGGFKHF